MNGPWWRPNISAKRHLMDSPSIFRWIEAKWNKIEHRMFSFISMNWRGRPLVSYRTIVELISNTTTTKGLSIRAEEDLNYYKTGTKVSAAELAAVPLRPHKFHGNWNYSIAQSDSR